MTSNSVAEGIVRNQLLLAAGRVSMALFLPILGLFWFLFDQSLDTRFDAQSARYEIVAARLDNVEDAADKLADETKDLTVKVSSREASAVRGQAARDAAELAMLDEIKSLRTAMSALNANVAALSAKVEILLAEKRADAGETRPGLR